jgi:hypothetical protein
MNKTNLGVQDLTDKAAAVLRRVQRYSVPLFLVFVALIYGFIVLQINTLSNAQPSEDAVTSQVQADRITHIDPAIVKQLQSLQDNSVNVKTLFNQARANPFQE